MTVPDYVAIGILVVLAVWAVADWIPARQIISYKAQRCSRVCVRYSFGTRSNSPSRLTLFLPTLRHSMPEARHFHIQRAFLRRRGGLS